MFLMEILRVIVVCIWPSELPEIWITIMSKKMKVLYPGCLIKVTVRMGVNLFYCGCLVALDFHTDGKCSSLWNHNRGGG